MFSVLSDLHPPSKRNLVNALAMLASGAGLVLGQGIAGLLGPAVGWRAPFVVVGALGVLSACEMRSSCPGVRLGAPRGWLPLGVSLQGGPLQSEVPHPECPLLPQALLFADLNPSRSPP